MAVSVYFATNRAPLIDSAVPNNFGTKFSTGAITFGRAIFQSVADESEIGNSNLSIDSLNTGGFLKTSSDALVAGPDHLLIYIHGFDYRFREALMRAAWLGEWFARGIPAIDSFVIVYSWPSLGSLTIEAYKKDYKSATASSDAFRKVFVKLVPLIRAFRQKAANRRVTLMAHSMGNHCLHAGLKAAIGTGAGQVALPGAAGLFDQAMLIAGDENAKALSAKSGLSSLLTLATSVVVYYNNQDVPLNLISHPIHHVDRLGMDGPPNKPDFKGQNISFVNCSAANRKLANGERQDPEWHQYYRLVPEVRDDLCGVMAGAAPDALPNRIYRKAKNYYRLDLKP